jgi:pyruvate/2-oxoglutarate/acetoin dehydrogenase E1 component
MPDNPTYLEAINLALTDEMERDESVILMGVDVGEAGGVYGVTRGLHDRWPNRVLDTPIAEAGVVGAAVGAAMTGLRPIVEIMYIDFITVCLDPIVNQAAKLRYMTGGGTNVPVVFRTQTGSGQSAGAQHSQSLEVLLAHIPGLRVFYPSDGRDAYDLLVAAIRDDNPVCFIENRRLYNRESEDWDRAPLAPGTPRIVREGNDVTVVSWGRMVSETTRAIAGMEDVDPEVIDLRTLAPLDLTPVFESVSRTGRCLIVHDAVERFGAGAEISARIAEEVLYDLDGPVERLGALPSPVPYSRSLERAMLPNHERIADRIRAVVNA